MNILRILVSFLIAVLIGMVFKKLKLPTVLGWLLTGLLLSPFALGLMPPGLENSEGYKLFLNFIKFGVGATLGIGANKSKNSLSKKQLLVVSLFESIGTFVLVAAAFSIVFSTQNVPLFLAFVFGSIAMVTSLATTIAILKSYKAAGTLSSSVVPVMSTSSLIGIVFFMLVLGVSLGSTSSQNASASSILLSIIASVGSGLAFGAIGTFIINRIKSEKPLATSYYFILIVASILTVSISHWVMQQSGINYLIAGICFSIVLSNRVHKEKSEYIQQKTQKPLGLIFAFFIFSLGASINYRFIFEAGLLAVLFFITRFSGKVVFSRVGGKIAKIPESISQNMGYLLLPHSSICLIFTAIAAESLSPLYPAETLMLQGAITAALLVNEIIAPLLIKQSLKKTGELPSIGQ